MGRAVPVGERMVPSRIRSTGDRRCWPCTVVNAGVGLTVAWLPLAAMLVQGRGNAVPVALGWGLAVTTFTGYRLLDRGYLPLAEPVARWTGLHDRLGPGRTERTRDTSAVDADGSRGDDNAE